MEWERLPAITHSGGGGGQPLRQCSVFMFDSTMVTFLCCSQRTLGRCPAYTNARTLAAARRTSLQHRPLTWRLALPTTARGSEHPVTLAARFHSARQTSLIDEPAERYPRGWDNYCGLAAIRADFTHHAVRAKFSGISVLNRNVYRRYFASYRYIGCSLCNLQDSAMESQESNN